jgi:FkbM family methyltransferase
MPPRIVTAAGLKIECLTTLEMWRVSTLLTKEPGTIQWLQAIQPGEVLYDVGANIGLYTLLAAAQGALVTAFEPHVGNADRLLRNVALNGQGERVRVITSALHEQEGYLPFNYLQHAPGSSGSQLGHVRLERGGEFAPVARELKHATTADRLVGDGLIPPATVIKIDVDGNEPQVLRGMAKLLAGSSVRSIQVEMHPATDAEIVRILAGHDFMLSARHHTSQGQAAITEGADPLAVPHNAIFTRKDGTAC